MTKPTKTSFRKMSSRRRCQQRERRNSTCGGPRTCVCSVNDLPALRLTTVTIVRRRTNRRSLTSARNRGEVGPEREKREKESTGPPPPPRFRKFRTVQRRKYRYYYYYCYCRVLRRNASPFLSVRRLVTPQRWCFVLVYL